MQQKTRLKLENRKSSTTEKGVAFSRVAFVSS